MRNLSTEYQIVCQNRDCEEHDTLYRDECDAWLCDSCYEYWCYLDKLVMMNSKAYVL